MASVLGEFAVFTVPGAPVSSPQVRWYSTPNQHSPTPCPPNRNGGRRPGAQTGYAGGTEAERFGWLSRPSLASIQLASPVSEVPTKNLGPAKQGGAFGGWLGWHHHLSSLDVAKNIGERMLKTYYISIYIIVCNSWHACTTFELGRP